MAMSGAAAAAGVNFFTTLITINVIDRFGRKDLLIAGTYGMCDQFLDLLVGILLIDK